MTFARSLDSVNEELLRTLIGDEVAESRQLEYKREFKLGRLKNGTPEEREDRLEFLRDVSSFANAGGGDILLGIAEVKSKPTKLFPLDIPDWDARKREIHNAIDSGVESRIPGVILHLIPVTEEGKTGFVLLVRVPRSFCGPHRVKETREFWSRHTNCKYELDVPELRTAFTYADSLRDRVRAFREERLGRILGGDAPVHLDPRPALVLHAVPASDEPSANLALLNSEAEEAKMLTVISHDSFRGSRDWFLRTFNADGFCSCFRTREESAERRVIPSHSTPSYLQVFRNGAVEFVEGRVVPSWHERFLIQAGTLESCLLDHNGVRIGSQPVSPLDRVSRILALVGAYPPVFVSISLLYARGLEMSPEVPVGRDVLTPPDILELLPRHLQSAFDVLYQACGVPRSPVFSELGDYPVRR